MVLLEAATHLTAAVLVLSGAAKLRSPATTVPTLQALGLPAGRAAVAALGAVEVGAGAAALVSSSWVGMAGLAAVWWGLTATAVVLARRTQRIDCGCFGAARAPLGPAHVAVNAVAAAVAVAAVARPPTTVPSLLASEGTILAASYAGLLAAGATAVAAILTSLPATASLAR